MAAEDEYIVDNEYMENYLFDLYAYESVPEEERASNWEKGWHTPISGAPGDWPEGWHTPINGVNDDGITPFYDSIRNPDPMNVVYNSFAGTDIVAQMVIENEILTLGELQTISYSIHRENVPVRILGHVNPISFVRGPRTIAGSLIFTVFNQYAFYRLHRLQEGISRGGVYSVADMLPPIDIVLTFSNESGALSKMRILGVQIIDEGQTMSVDDLITEQTYSFMARGIQPMTGYAMRTEHEIDILEGPRDVSRLQV